MKRKKRKDKTQKRCIVSNRLINGNDEVVIASHAIEYVKILGYDVVPTRYQYNRKLAVAIMIILSITYGAMLHGILR